MQFYSFWALKHGQVVMLEGGLFTVISAMKYDKFRYSYEARPATFLEKLGYYFRGE